MKPPGLAWPLSVSLIVHLCLLWLFAPGPAEQMSRRVTAVSLSVVLPAREHAAAQSAANPYTPPAATPATAGAPVDIPGRITQRARFIVPPDLSDLEAIPVPFSGSLTLRLHVAALGTVDRVTLVKGDPVPRELLDGLLNRFEHARLEPALAGSTPVASTLDLIIGYEAGPQPLQREP